MPFLFTAAKYNVAFSRFSFSGRLSNKTKKRKEFQLFKYLTKFYFMKN